MSIRHKRVVDKYQRLEQTRRDFEIASKPSVRPKKLKKIQEGKTLRQAKKR